MKLTTFIIFFLPVFCTNAHEIRPAYLEIKENADHSLSITWKQPLMGEFGLPLHPSITAGWLTDSLSQRSYTESYLIKRWNIPANHAPLDQQIVRIEGLEKTITDALVQIILAEDHSHTYLLKPLRPFVKLNVSKPQPPPVWQYIQLGVWHIWSGYDHLLFVFGLLLLVKKSSRLFWTITAFTIAHSITLALATLHIVSVSSSFSEPAIALSIVFLAVELVHHYRGQDGITYRYPWLVSFLFGLLHGLGFASALSDVGLPANNIPFALFLFNAGVELGQLSFMFLIFLIITLLTRVKMKLPLPIYYLSAYTIGTLAMYWFIGRLLIF